MIKKVMKAGGIGLILLSLVGCLQVDTLVKVKPDGSGTIEETFMMSKEVAQLIKEMAEQMMEGLAEPEKGQPSKQPKQKQAKESFDLFDEAKLKQEADGKGEGVTYVSGKKIATDTFEGYKAIYAFANINKLKLNQNPSDSMPSEPSGSGSEKQEYVTFHFTKGRPATLIVRLPDVKPDEKDDATKSAEASKPSPADNKQSEMMLAQMKKMFKDMKIAMAIEVQGAVVQTNATHREGSRITMMELDFNKLLQMPEKLVQFSQLQPETLEDAKKFMKDLPGIKAEMNKEVTIKFK
ncbi:MAG: hypothetical protein JSV01_06380 [Desulfobacterales bacterium]|nr:MAG: hypothetical protein JSV01_06380 [Desulfobacterales bacterium]